MSSNKFERGSYKNKDGKVVETFSLNLGLKKFKVGEEVVVKKLFDGGYEQKGICKNGVRKGEPYHFFNVKAQYDNEDIQINFDPRKMTLWNEFEVGSDVVFKKEAYLSAKDEEEFTITFNGYMTFEVNGSNIPNTGEASDEVEEKKSDVVAQDSTTESVVSLSATQQEVLKYYVENKCLAESAIEFEGKLSTFREILGKEVIKNPEVYLQ